MITKQVVQTLYRNNPLSMKKILLIAMSALFLIGNVNAQRKAVHSHSNVPAHRTCGTPELPIEFETWMEKKIKERELLPASQRTAIVYNLPVVVHVIHSGTAVGAGLNISDAQIQSQIEILNEDFRKLNSDTSLIPSAFRPVAGDCEINFCLAKTDPNGNLTTGVNRINRVTQGWTTPPYSQTYINATIKPATIWNPNQYLNIWVTNLSGGLLGYATFPSGSTLTGLTGNFGTLTSDGVVILYNAFGDVGALSPPYNKGRTATHEVGHWLGLRHIWGDSNCGTDYVTDTPIQQTSNFSCPTYPQVTCSNGPNGDMFMNYMDYTDDACMYMFTNGQKTRVQTVMANSPFRVALAASNKCSPPVVAAPVAAFTANTTAIAVGGSVNFTDNSTNSPSSWSWTFAGGTPSTSSAQSPNGITYAAAGTYDVTLTATNGTGSNTLTKTGYIVVTGSGGGGCDTITNFDLVAHTPSILGSAGWGYVAGHNDYLDIGKADKYTIVGSNQEITGTYISFGVGSSSGTGQTATVTVWDNNGTGGLPNSILGTAVISYDSIAAYAASLTPMWIDFSPNIAVSGDVYVGISFGYTPGDTLAIIHCADGEITTGTAYEHWSNLSWHAYSEAPPVSWGVNVAHLILPVVCTSTGVEEKGELSTIAIYPNPTRGELNILIAEQKSRGDISFKVMNTVGAVVYTETMNSNSTGKYQLQLASLSQGFYFLEISTSEGRRIQKFQLSK